MGWPYHFVDLTSPQRHQRRELLDYYGFIAQISALVPLVLIQVWYLIALTLRKFGSLAPGPTPSSPRLKKRHGRTSELIRYVFALWRRTVWWLGDSIELAGCDLGTRGELAASIVWSAWLLLLCFVQTGDDYLHVTKRFGIVGASQLPIHYVLAMKTPYSPLMWLMRTSYGTLNSLHQTLGRIITAFFYLHVSFYLNFYIISNILGSKLQEGYVLCGLGAILCFTIIGTSALSILRKRYYKVFYILHVTLAAAILPLLYFHVSHIRIYIYETIVIYGLNVAVRKWNTQTLPVSIRKIDGSNLVQIDIKASPAEVRRWSSGQHGYISLRSWAHLIGGSNPLTLASVPSVDSNLRFVSRVMNGNTTKLAKVAADQNRNGQTSVAYLEGPYELASHAHILLEWDRVLFVAGGIGATFVVPLYRQLLADLSPSRGSSRRQRVSFLWVTRRMADVTWALPHTQKEREGFSERLRVCLTQPVDGLTSSRAISFRSNVDTDQSLGVGDDGPDAMELEQTTKLPDHDAGNVKTHEDAGIQAYAGRPYIASIIREVFSAGSSERVAIVVCGPKQLSQDLRVQIGGWVLQDRQVQFWDERFSFS